MYKLQDQACMTSYTYHRDIEILIPIRVEGLLLCLRLEDFLTVEREDCERIRFAWQTWSIHRQVTVKKNRTSSVRGKNVLPVNEIDVKHALVYLKNKL